MKKIIIVSASPKKKGDRAVSALLSERAIDRFSSSGLQADIIDVREALKNSAPAFEAMKSADALLIVFPLYIFCMPGMLTRFLEDYAAYTGQKQAGQKIFTVVNCGFPEPEINEEAVRVIKSFARHIGAEFGFGVCIGSGGMVLGAKDAPFMKKPMAALNGAVDRMSADILHDQRSSDESVNIRVNFPRWMYFSAGNLGWGQMAKKNGLKKRDLYATPYRAE